MQLFVDEANLLFPAQRIERYCSIFAEKVEESMAGCLTKEALDKLTSSTSSSHSHSRSAAIPGTPAVSVVYTECSEVGNLWEVCEEAAKEFIEMRLSDPKVCFGPRKHKDKKGNELVRVNKESRAKVVEYARTINAKNAQKAFAEKNQQPEITKKNSNAEAESTRGEMRDAQPLQQKLVESEGQEAEVAEKNRLVQKNSQTSWTRLPNHHNFPVDLQPNPEPEPKTLKRKNEESEYDEFGRKRNHWWWDNEPSGYNFPKKVEKQKERPKMQAVRPPSSCRAFDTMQVCGEVSTPEPSWMTEMSRYI